MELWILLLTAIAACEGQNPVFDWDTETELDKYVNYDDGFYSWFEMTDHKIRYDENNVTVFQLNMTSQSWPRYYTTLTTRPIWWHYVGIAVPDVIRYTTTAAVWLGNGENDDPPQDKLSLWNTAVAEIASDTGMVTSYVLQVPNEDLLFTNYPIPNDPIGSDDLIAWTWRTVMDWDETTMGPVDWSVVASAPMTKASKRAVDAVQEFGQSYLGLQFDDFMAIGASKRGWTVWSLAAVDPRIKVAFPIVCNLLNMPEVFFRHYESMGEAWSFAFDPYWNHPPNLTKSLFNEHNEGIFNMEDMHRYRPRFVDREQMMVVASGDEFFFLDNTHIWWQDIPEPKHMYLVQNAEHVLFPQYDNVYDAIVSAIMVYLRGQEMPIFTWKRGFTPDGAWLEMVVDPIPDEITAWRAETSARDERRDFRLITAENPDDPDLHNVLWRNDTAAIIDMGDGIYRIEEANVANEWVGFFFQATWYTDDESSRGGMRDLYLTTEAHITPDTFPGTRCTQDPDCYGYLV